MVKTVLTINGMACGMCESHVNDAIHHYSRMKKITRLMQKAKRRSSPKSR